MADKDRPKLKISDTDFKMFVLGMSGFSFAQFLGILTMGFDVFRMSILIFLLIFLSLIPGFLAWGNLQRMHVKEISKVRILACFTPSFIAIAILLSGFLLGGYLAW